MKASNTKVLPPPQAPSAGRACVSLDQRHAIERRIHALPILEHLEVTARVKADGSVVARIDPLREYHVGGMEAPVVNGGVLLGLFDCALVGAGMACAPLKTCATLEVSAKLIRPVRGAAVEARGWVLRRTRHVIFVEAEIRDAQGTVCATASGIVAPVADRVAVAPSEDRRRG